MILVTGGAGYIDFHRTLLHKSAEGRVSPFPGHRGIAFGTEGACVSPRLCCCNCTRWPTTCPSKSVQFDNRCDTSLNILTKGLRAFFDFAPLCDKNSHSRNTLLNRANPLRNAFRDTHFYTHSNFGVFYRLLTMT